MNEEKKIYKALNTAEVDINGFKLSCAVLEDTTRVFSERSLANAFGIKGSGAFWRKKKANDSSAFLPEYLSANYLKDFISDDLTDKLSSAYDYVSVTGTESRGVDATVLADICDVYITAKNSGIKNENIDKVADAAYKLVKGFAKVGIIALIDEATGYQYEREETALQQILKELVADEIQDYEKDTFHLSFYKEIFRIWNIPFTEKNIKRKPQFIGHITTRFVYNNLPAGTYVVDKIKKQTPKTKGGNYKFRWHQSMTPKTGRELLKKTIYSVEALASISDSKDKFKHFINEKYGQKTLFSFDELDKLAKENDDVKTIEDKPKEPLSDFNTKLQTALNYKPKKENKKILP